MRNLECLRRANLPHRRSGGGLLLIGEVYFKVFILALAFGHWAFISHTNESIFLVFIMSQLCNKGSFNSTNLTLDYG